MSRHRRELGGSLACVTFAAPAMLGRFREHLGVEIPLYADPERGAYRAFGFERASVRRVWLDPRVWWRYAQMLARGRRPRRSGMDTLQLGGDVVVAAGGRIAWVRRSRGPEDRPHWSEVAAVLRDAA